MTVTVASCPAVGHSTGIGYDAEGQHVSVLIEFKFADGMGYTVHEAIIAEEHCAPIGQKWRSLWGDQVSSIL